MRPPPAGGVEVRTARVADAEDLARVHVAGWQHAYRGLMPDDYLDALDWRDRVEQRRAGLADAAVSTYVAVQGGEVVGFAAHGPSRDDDLPGGQVTEVYAIYLREAALGQGVGSALLGRCIADAPPGVLVTLWVLEGNARARRFYERHGFVPDGAVKTYAVAGRELPEVRYRLDRAAGAARSR